MSTGTSEFPLEYCADGVHNLDEDEEYFGRLPGNFAIEDGQRGCNDLPLYSSSVALRGIRSYDEDLSTFYPASLREFDPYYGIDFPSDLYEKDAFVSVNTNALSKPPIKDTGSHGDCETSFSPLPVSPDACHAFTTMPTDFPTGGSFAPHDLSYVSAVTDEHGDYCAHPDGPMLFCEIPNFVKFTSIIVVDHLVEDFKRSILDKSTRIEDQWPERLPPWKCFYGRINLGLVDFCGGAKAGTPYMLNEQEGLLVNYSGKGIEKLRSRYQMDSIDKLLKIRLITIEKPTSNEDHWTIQEIRSNGTSPSKVYMYNKMAMYTFGGTIYTLNSEMQLEEDASVDSTCRFITLSQARSRAPNKTAKRPLSPGTRNAKKQRSSAIKILNDD